MSHVYHALPGGGSKVFNQDLQVVCMPVSKTNSNGVFLGDDPLQFTLPLLLLQVSLIFFTTRLTHFFLKHLGQPRFVSQLILFPNPGSFWPDRADPWSSTMSTRLDFLKNIFRPQNRLPLENISLFGVILYLFKLGVMTDLGMLRRSGRKAIAIGLLGTLISFLLVTLICFFLRHSLPADLRQGYFLLLVTSRMSVTSFAVTTITLQELKLLNSELGRLALSATLVSDIHSWVISALATALFLGATARTPTVGLLSFLTFASLLAFIVLIARPAVLWIVRRAPEGHALGEGSCIGVLLLALVCGFVSESIGQHAAFGPFILGLALPGASALSVTLERIDCLLSGLLIPIYMVVAGLRTGVEPGQAHIWLYLELIVIVCFVGKLVGTIIPSVYCRMSLRDALSLGLILNIKGIIEIVTINQWSYNGHGELLGDGAVGDARNGDDDAAHQGDVQAVEEVHCLQGADDTELEEERGARRARVRAHRGRRPLRHRPSPHDHGFPAHLPLLNPLRRDHHLSSSSSSEGCVGAHALCVYLLHLIPLAGRAAPVLRAYRRSLPSSSSCSDHIVSAFRNFERRTRATAGWGLVSVTPYVAIAPHATMHDDVCQLALDKGVPLVVVPFHRNTASAGSPNLAVRAMNRKVIAYAPCSVGILVSHCARRGGGGATEVTPRAATLVNACSIGPFRVTRVGMLFIGGPDDREGLALASRMAENYRVELTVVRFLPPEQWRGVPNKEARIDAETLAEFRLAHNDNERVEYTEAEVRDGEATLAAMRAMGEKGLVFDLVMVGRRRGQESTPTAGLSLWSEYPELGVFGDALASVDFGRSGIVSSILVVQQQARIRGGEEADEEEEGSGEGIGWRGEADDEFVEKPTRLMCL
ncbi:Cation/H(+) antiporter 15 [Acorus calamus]|uniref:Cation/H(+) antiporter 15 n=1 Tax=Acorus calamus TaxID=4465 RepID=A0AAV9C8C2_ACOCL|nr:Cation/H(+) antiporter 15 [Acorus calamus]